MPAPDRPRSRRRPSPRRCWSGPYDDASLRAAVTAGQLAAGDAAALREFRDLLAGARSASTDDPRGDTTP